MRKNRNELNFIKQVIFSILAIGVVAAFLFAFCVKNQNAARERVGVELVDDVDVLAERFGTSLETLAEESRIMIGYFESLNADGVRIKDEVIQQGMRTLCATTKYDRVVLCKRDGSGFDQTGVDVDLSGESYFAFVGFSTAPVYTYTSNLQGEDQVAFIVSVPIRLGDEVCSLIGFSKASNYESLLTGSNKDQRGFTCVTDRKGNILAKTNSTHSLMEGSNLIESYPDQNNRELSKIRNRLNSSGSGTVTLTGSSVACTLAFSATKIGDFYLITGITPSQFDRLVSADWKAVEHLARVVMISVIAVVLAGIGFTLVAKRKTLLNNKKLEEKAETDELTGLVNKAATERKIREYMQSNPNDPGMFILLDVDNFKKINDTMGHSFGDEVLHALGTQISTNFRVTDVVGRVGGDEFMIFLKHIKGEEIIQKEADKLIYFFRNFTVGSYVKYSPTASIGVAMFPKDGATFEKLYKSADAALYESKRNGKNQLTFYKSGTTPERDSSSDK